MNKIKYMFQGLHSFLLLWSTQALSSLGSGMTSYALVIWSYQAKGSALTTALLSVCTYAPYVVLSIFAGALSDKWNKKHTMLLCDSLAAASTLAVFLLLRTGHLEIWHLYVLNAFNGLMNTLQQPASDVAVSLLTPKEQYQRVGGMRSFSNSLVTVLTPVIATAILSLYSLTAVIVIDFITFGIAFLTLAFLIRIPPVPGSIAAGKASILSSAREGIGYLKKNRGILDMIVFLAAINLTASMYDAALPAMLLSREGGGRTALGLVNACTGLANLAGSAAVPPLSSSQKPGKGDLQFPSLFHEHRKLSSGFWTEPSRMVHRGSSGMAVYSCDECQYGCALPLPHPFRDAGTGVFCTKYPPVFYHTGRISSGRAAGG